MNKTKYQKITVFILFLLFRKFFKNRKVEGQISLGGTDHQKHKLKFKKLKKEEVM